LRSRAENRPASRAKSTKKERKKKEPACLPKRENDDEARRKKSRIGNKEELKKNDFDPRKGSTRVKKIKRATTTSSWEEDQHRQESSNLKQGSRTLRGNNPNRSPLPGGEANFVKKEGDSASMENFREKPLRFRGREPTQKELSATDSRAKRKKPTTLLRKKPGVKNLQCLI